VQSKVVAFKIALLAEMHSANVTSKFFLPCVRGKMNFQIMGFSKDFEAVCTSGFSFIIIVGIWWMILMQSWSLQKV